MGVYFCLNDAEGPYQFEIELRYLDKDQTVGKGAISPIEIKNRLETHDFGLNISAIVLPGPGRYEFRLYANGQFITQKDFYVIQQESPPKTSTS